VAEEKPWWEDPGETWTEGEPLRVVKLFAAAYPTADELGTVAGKAGLDRDTGPSNQSIEDAWRSMFGQATAQGRALSLAVRLLFDPAKGTYRSPLINFLGDRLPRAFDLGVVDGLQAPPTEGPGTARLESIVSNRAGFTDVIAYIRAIEDQVRRTARIQRRGSAVGTGVLVGDDLLLTAGHVLDVKVWPPDVEGMEAVFDFNSAGGGSLADSGTATTITELVYGFPPSDAEIGATVGDLEDAPSDKLDFVVVRLDRQIGLLPADRPRQFYRLDDSDYDLGKAPEIRIVSHPAGNWATESGVVGTIKPTPGGTRIRYVTNTTPGSSGAPIVDANGRLVGIHTYGTQTGNRGVPFSLISKLLKASEHAALFQPTAAVAALAAVAPKSASPFATTVLGGYPLVDRKSLRDKLEEMTTGDQGYRQLAIAGGPRMGKSYSFTLISHIASESRTSDDLLNVAPQGIDAVLIDLRHYSGYALDELFGEVSRFLLTRTGLLKAEEKFAIKNQVAKTVIDLLNTSPVFRDPGRQWWICFDSIDDMARLRASGLTELIGGIIRISKEDLQLRIRVVLGGLQVTDLLDELGQILPNQDSPGNLLPGHVLEWVEAEASRKSRQIEVADLRAELDAFVGEELATNPFPEAGLPPETIVGYLPAFLDRVSPKGE
jgi:hypothetical protein